MKNRMEMNMIKIKMKMKTKESFSSKLLGHMLMCSLIEVAHLLATHLIPIQLLLLLCGIWLHGLPHLLPTVGAKLPSIFSAFTTSTILELHAFVIKSSLRKSDANSK